MKECSFIIEFDEISENQVNKLWEFLENKNIKFHVLKDEDFKKENHELKNQQKEFIEWLENESKEVIRDAGYHQRICLEILDKYKEIIGDKKERDIDEY